MQVICETSFTAVSSFAFMNLVTMMLLYDFAYLPIGEDGPKSMKILDCHFHLAQLENSIGFFSCMLFGPVILLQF